MAWLRDTGIRYIILPTTARKESSAEFRAAYAMANAWRLNTDLFAPVKRFDFPHRDGLTLRRIDIFELRPAPGADT